MDTSVLKLIDVSTDGGSSNFLPLKSVGSLERLFFPKKKKKSSRSLIPLFGFIVYISTEINVLSETNTE